MWPLFGAKPFAIVGGARVADDYSSAVAVTPRGEGENGVLDLAVVDHLINVVLCLVSRKGNENVPRRDRIFRSLYGGFGIIEGSDDMVLEVEECGLGRGELRGLTLYLTLPNLEAVVGVVIGKSGQFNAVVDVVAVVVVATVF